MLGACSLDRGDLAAFQHTATGPDKLRAILVSTDREGPLRAEAALALLDLPRTDVDGQSLLFRELRHLPEASKRAILPRFKDGLSARMRTAKGTPLSRSALRAKDAGGKLLALLPEEERALLGSELLQFMADDLARRGNMGSFSFEQVADKVGAKSAPALIAALDGDMNLASVQRIAAAIDAHATPSARKQAAARLLQVERAFRDRAARHGASAAPELLAVLGRFTDQAAVRTRLVDIAADASLPTQERTRALELMEGHTGEAELERLLELAQSSAAPPALRVLALTRAGETQSRSVLPVCFVLVTDRKHQALRQRAGELSLALGGTEGAVSFFRNLPTGWGIKYAKPEIDAYAEQLAKLSPNYALLLLLGAKLHSSFWWNRVMALHYFASRGTAEDVWRIRQHVHDEQIIYGPGYPQGHTVGQEAEGALAMALTRLRAASKH